MEDETPLNARFMSCMDLTEVSIELPDAILWTAQQGHDPALVLCHGGLVCGIISLLSP